MYRKGFEVLAQGKNRVVEAGTFAVLRNGSSAFVLGFAMLLVASIWLLAFNQIATERTAFRRNVTDHLGNIAITLAHNISRTSGELDTLLKFMRAMKKSRGPAVPWQKIVSEDYTLNRHTVQIAVIAKNGMMVTSTKMLYPDKPVDLSDREHYVVHRETETDQLFISRPVLGRASGKWSVQYTRPLFAAEDVFDGVIVVSLDPARLTQIYSNLDLGANGGVVIVGADGIIRAGTGHYAKKLGQPFEEGKDYREIEAGSRVAAAGLERRSGVNKIVATQPVDGYPLKVVILADDIGGLSWFLKVQTYIFGAILLTLLTAYAAYSAIQFRHRELTLLREQSRVLVEKEVAEAASAAKGEFLAIMSHEIRTPLNGVLGALELMRSEDLSVRARRHLGIASTSGEFLLSLIDDILVFSKLEDGNYRLDEAPQGLPALLGGLEAVYAPMMRKSGNRLRLEIDRDTPDCVVCDGVRLRQVLVNLLGNANKFTSSGEIVLSCEVLSLGESSVRLRFAVADTGLGIPKDKQAVVFEKFQSLDRSYSRRSDGTGLGLAICDKIVRAMGGTIALDSEPGRGSTFSFAVDFTVAGAAEAKDEDEAAPADRPGSGSLRVLLAEDNATNAYISTQHLLAAGHDVVHVVNGRRAVEEADATCYDLVLMDISMPEMDGLAAARAIRSGGGASAAVPILALTAHAVPGTAEKVREAGMSGYLTKPLSRERLLVAVRRFGGAGQTAEPKSVIALSPPIIDEAEFRDFLSERELDPASPILGIFLNELEARRAALQAARTEANLSAAGAIAHAVYGSAATVGASRLATQCRQLERATARPETFDWQLADALLETLAATIREFAGRIEHGSPDEDRQACVA